VISRLFESSYKHEDLLGNASFRGALGNHPAK